MDIGNNLLHRAYVLVEAEVADADAIEDLVTLARGNVDNLKRARDRATTGADMVTDPMTLELAGFEPYLLQVADNRRAALSDLLDRAIASFS